MDPLTHATLGCAAGALVGGNRRAAALGAVVALLPDLDLLLLPLLDGADRFGFHRGPSHSLLLGLVLAPLLGWAAARWWRRRDALRAMPDDDARTAPLRGRIDCRPSSSPLAAALRATLVVAAAWISHLLCDGITGFGTAVLWPFSDWRMELDLVYVVDPLVTLPLLAAAWLLWRRPRWPARRITAIALVLVCGYLGLAATSKALVAQQVREHYRTQGTPAQRLHLAPTPGNSLLWYVASEHADGFRVRHRSLLDGDYWEATEQLPRGHAVLAPWHGDALVDEMRDTMRGWYSCRKAADGSVHLIDLRCGKRNGWDADGGRFVFDYRLARGADGVLDYTVQRTPSGLEPERLEALALRVLGSIARPAPLTP